MGNSATISGGLPPLPPGAVLNTPASGGLPPLPPGATLSTATTQPGANPPSSSPAATPSNGAGAAIDRLGSSTEGLTGAGDEVARGFLKSASQAMGGLIDMVRSKADPGFAAVYKTDHPNATDQEIEQAYAQQNLQGRPQGARIAQHLQDAAEWLRSGSEPQGFWQHVGAIGEQVLEYIGTDGLLKMAGGTGAIARAGQAGGRAAQTAEDLKQAQQVAATLKNNPKLAGLVSIGLKASKDAAGIGAQTYVHTEDPEQSAIAGATGGGLSAVAGAAGAAGEYLQKIAPRTVRIAGEDVPALSSQLNEAGEPLGTSAVSAPEVAQAQQRAAQNVIRNTAAQATASALENINRTRPAFAPIEDASRMLTGGEGGGEPFVFRLQGPPSDTIEGELTSPAEEIPRTHTSLPADRTGATKYSRVGSEPEYIQPSGPGGAISERTGRSWAERRIPGYMHTGPEVEGAGDVSRTGNLETTDPMEAEGWLRQLEDLQGTPEHAQLPQGEQDAIEAQRQALNDQLDMYHSSPYAQRFAPVDAFGAAGKVQTFGDAAAQIRAAAKPVYTTLDRLSGGQFHTLDEVAKRQLKLMRNPSSEEAFAGAQAKYREAVGQINDLINANRGQVSMGDYLTAKNAWRDGARLDELHGVFERMANGVTQEETESGLTRIMTGNAKRLENYLAEGTNREQLENLIGKEGVVNLKRMTLLLTKANTARVTTSVLANVAHELHYAARSGAILGGVAGEMFGGHWAPGAAVGAGVGVANAGLRAVLRYAATSPRIGNMVEFAVSRGMSPQHYAPLIARAIAEPFETPLNGSKEETTSSKEEHSQTMAEAAPKGLIEAGNLPIWNRPVIENEDGTHSSEYSVSFEDEHGREVLVPTVVNGRFLTPTGQKPREGSAEEKQMFKRAWQHYQDTGEHLGMFDNAEDADRYSQILHNRENNGAEPGGNAKIE